LEPTDIKLEDSRAHKLLIVYSENKWNAIPSTEVFSRYSGTCVILGDRNRSTLQNLPHKICLGDCFRFGSVGVVVCEMRSVMNGEEKKLDSKTIQFLKDEALTLNDDIEDDELATFAIDECRLSEQQRLKRTTRERTYSSNSKSNHSMSNNNGVTNGGGNSKTGISSNGLLNGDKFVCYMCYENTDTPENPLVAPCECRGDTRYLLTYL
jgi:hypothetical protein